MAAEQGASRGTALITGASAGIGRELAFEFARHGFDLVLVARRRSLLDEVAAEVSDRHGVEVEVVPLDLLDATAAEELAQRARLGDRPVDVLVNNAGVLEFGAFQELDAAAVDRLVQLNVAALARITHRFVGPMVERGSGRILNVASLASFQPVPMLGLYAATKAFVLSFTESLSEELRGTGVTATALCPGVTDTDMVRGAEGFDASRMPPLLVQTPAAVARAGYRACMAGRVIEVPGIGNLAVANWVRYQPRWLVRAVGGLFGRAAGS